MAQSHLRTVRGPLPGGLDAPHHLGAGLAEEDWARAGDLRPLGAVRAAAPQLATRQPCPRAASTRTLASTLHHTEGPAVGDQ
eukprot:9056220-Pyramimonas_sp.AAC.1